MTSWRGYAVVAAIVVALCRIGGGEPGADSPAPSISLRPSAAEIARELLDAMKRGDAHAFLQRLDLKALYDDTVKQEDEETDFPTFVENLREQAEAAFGDEPTDEFEYEITGTVTIVRVKVRHGENDAWREHEIAFAEEDGQSRITLEGMKQLDFGHGRGGPIARHARRAESAEAAAMMILEGMRQGDMTVLLDHLDLKGMYEQQVPEEAREQMSYEEFEKMTREAAKNEEPPEDLEYEILASEAIDDTVVVTINVKEGKDADWHWLIIPFKKIDGAWRITSEGVIED